MAEEFKIDKIATQYCEKGGKSSQFLGRKFLMFEDRKILVADLQGNLAVHRIKDNKLKRGDDELFSEHNDAITYMKLNDKYDKLVTCSGDGHIVIWNFPQMSLIHYIQAHKASIN